MTIFSHTGIGGKIEPGKNVLYGRGLKLAQFQQNKYTVDPVYIKNRKMRVLGASRGEKSAKICFLLY